MRPCESGTAATANPPAAATSARSAMKRAGEGFLSRRIRRSLQPAGPRSRPRGCLLVARGVRERRLVAAAPAEGVLDRGGARALLVDVDLEALLVVPRDNAGDRLLIGDRLGDPHRHVFADPEPPLARRVVDLDRRHLHARGAAGLERPGELLERRAPGLTRVDGLERGALAVVRFVVEVQHEVPRRGSLVVVVTADEDYPPSAQICAGGVAVDDLPRECPEADPVGRATALAAADPPARADGLAVAGLEVGARQGPRTDFDQVASPAINVSCSAS